MSRDHSLTDLDFFVSGNPDEIWRGLRANESNSLDRTKMAARDSGRSPNMKTRSRSIAIR